MYTRTIYDEVMVAGMEKFRVGVMVSKRNVNKDDAIICSSGMAVFRNYAITKYNEW